MVIMPKFNQEKKIVLVVLLFAYKKTENIDQASDKLIQFVYQSTNTKQ